MNMTKHDYKRLARHGLGHRSELRALIIQTSLVVILWLLVMIVWCSSARAADAPDGFHLDVGIGFHDPAYDWHLQLDPQSKRAGSRCNNSCWQGNPMGMVRMSYRIHRFEFGVEHISSIPNHTDDDGLNLLYVTVRIF
jgi:hypothetical protein